MALIEQTLCCWCLDLLGLPAASGVGVVTGATVANTQAILAARDALLARQGWNTGERGLFGAPEVPVLIGPDSHSAPRTGLRYAGLGTGEAIRLGADDQGRVRLDALEAALAGCDHPPLVVLQAGQINTDAFDPFAQAIPVVHVDCAHIGVCNDPFRWPRRFLLQMLDQRGVQIARLHPQHDARTGAATVQRHHPTKRLRATAKAAVRAKAKRPPPAGDKGCPALGHRKTRVPDQRTGGKDLKRVELIQLRQDRAAVRA